MMNVTTSKTKERDLISKIQFCNYSNPMHVIFNFSVTKQIVRITELFQRIDLQEELGHILSSDVPM